MAKSKWQEVKNKLILVEGWARDGLTNEQIAEKLGINPDTLYKYQKQYPEFSEALKKGKEIVDYEVENALLNSALKGNVTAQIYWLNNRKPKQWRNKQDVNLYDNGTSLAEAIQKAYEQKVGDK